MFANNTRCFSDECMAINLHCLSSVSIDLFYINVLLFFTLMYVNVLNLYICICIAYMVRLCGLVIGLVVEC